MNPNILVEQHCAVSVVVMNRPQVSNCVNDTMAAEMRATFDRLEADPTVAAVILTGAGEVSFSSGLDLKQLAQQGPSLIPKVIFEDTGWAGIGRRHFPKPLIAAVNGYAIAGGLELMLSCDFAIASEHATFGCNEVTLGPIADAGGCFRLPQWIPLPYAKEMLLTGRMIDAQEAYRIGLVNRVVPQASLLSACIEIAQTTARNSSSSMAITKSLINETLNLPEEKAWVINDRYMRASFETDDFMEGPRAYVERREKQFVRP